MANVGIKITDRGEEATKTLTEGTKKLYQILSTDGCLIEKEKSSTAGTTDMFHGYKLSSTGDTAYPLNSPSGSETVYVKFHNAMPS